MALCRLLQERGGCVMTFGMGKMDILLVLGII